MDKDELTIRTEVAGSDATIGLAASGQPQDSTLRLGGRTAGTDVSPLPVGRQETFELRGQTYVCRKSLSDTSGEAQVFLVNHDGQDYVLKLYYPDVRLKKDVLQVVSNIRFDMIVRFYDFGKIYIGGRQRYYELMEYLCGGTLGTYKLGNDMDRFRRIALQAAAALACCHNYKVIHKDIKPSNFFFRDEKQTELVLGDFGISSVMTGEGHLHRTMQARTPMYAAPEMYNDVIDGEVEISTAADYYSLGITLLTLWNGKNPLGSDERVMMKRKNEGRLDGVRELPERVRMIVQGLTAVKPTSRWTYHEVEQWFLGESPKVDVTSPHLRYRSFIVDPERNLVADDLEELIPLLLDNERAACGFLYSGKITTWLEQSGNSKLSLYVDDIVKNKYPVDRHAGFMESIYTMAPDYPYKDVKGRDLRKVRDVVVSLLENIDEYAVMLANRNDNLWLYLETHTECAVDRMRGYFANIADEADGRHAVMRVVYELDPGVPFIVGHKSSTLKEIVCCFGYGHLPEDTWRSLTDGRLLSWMYSHEEQMACESLRILTEGKPYSEQLAYKVLYNIDRTAAYDLREADTPQKVGELMNEQLLEWQHLDDAAFAEKMTEYSSRDGRFQYFARLHGWMEQIGEAQRCFDLDSIDNRERLGAYDLRTAAYRMCRMLGVVPSYELPDGGVLKDGLDIDNKHRSAIRTEIRSGYFPQWLSVFYHENPQTDFGEAYSYERMLERWITVLGEYDAQMTYNKRFIAAKTEIARKYEEVRRGYEQAKTKEMFWRTAFYGLCGIWLLLLVVCGVGNHATLLKYAMLAVGVPVGGVTALIVGVTAYFRGNGFLISCLGAVLGFLTSLLPVAILRFVEMQWSVLLVPAIIVMTLIYMAICHLTCFRGNSSEDTMLMDDMLKDDIKTTLIEPLYYTFKTKSYRFKGSKFGILDDTQDRIRAMSGEVVIHYSLWTLMAALLVIEMVVYSPKLLDVNVPGQSNTHETVMTTVVPSQNNIR